MIEDVFGIREAMEAYTYLHDNVQILVRIRETFVQKGRASKSIVMAME